MTTGKLSIDNTTATVTIDGWTSDDDHLADALNVGWPVSRGPGNPVVKAFDDAVRDFGERAVIVEMPDPEPLPNSVIA